MSTIPSESVRITVIPGDGIGPEVMDATLALMRAAGARLEIEAATAGGDSFKAGVESGVPKETIDSIALNKVVLKGPLETPIGYGNKSANVTLRKFFETFANIRPARELPGVPTPFSGRGVDLVIVRENVEDLYAGIEHMQTPTVAQCLKVISKLGSQRISRAAFEYARSEGRKSVTVATKANIMKLTEGLFKREFETIAKDFPDISSGHILIDNCAHQMVMRPEQFDVIVTTNMNGDIISDLASGLVGGLGFAPSSNIGYEVAMFEPVHGSAPDIAGKGIANPTAMILSAVMLLKHIGQFSPAKRLESALIQTLEAGLHTKDIPGGNSLGTKEFTDEILSRIDTTEVKPVKGTKALELTRVYSSYIEAAGSRKKIGADIFIETNDLPEEISRNLGTAIEGTPYMLKMISNRGTQVWPPTGTTPTLVDVFRCRFVVADYESWQSDSILELLRRVGISYPWMHVERLEEVNGEIAFTRAQGES
jgi:isocitrate dehydrogenase